MIFCDISKAFDSVSNCDKMASPEIFFIGYQIIYQKEDNVFFIGSSVSEPKYTCTSAGVPQSSVLGPLFFLIYVNDIAENLLITTRLFADDSSLTFSVSNVKDTEGIFNHDLRTQILQPPKGGQCLSD